MKVKIYIDGASRGNPGSASAAVIIKNLKGEVIYSEGKFLGTQTNNFAEFSALKLACKRADGIKAGELDIYSDSLLLVNQYNGVYKIKNKVLFDLIAEIRVLSGKFKSVKLTHIPRNLNSEADKLANVILDEKSAK